MSSISVLQAPGPGQVTSVKTNSDSSSPAPSTTTAGTAATPVASGPEYPNPRFEIDPRTDRVIIEYRNTQTGNPTYQVPSKAQLLLYQGPQAPTTPGTSSTAV